MIRLVVSKSGICYYVDRMQPLLKLAELRLSLMHALCFCTASFLSSSGSDSEHNDDQSRAPSHSLDYSQSVDQSAAAYGYDENAQDNGSASYAAATNEDEEEAGNQNEYEYDEASFDPQAFFNSISVAGAQLSGGMVEADIHTDLQVSDSDER